MDEPDYLVLAEKASFFFDAEGLPVRCPRAMPTVCGGPSTQKDVEVLRKYIKQ